MLANVLLMRVILPPFDKYCLFQSANLLLILSSNPSQIDEALWLAPRGNPRYRVGRDPTLHPNSTAISSMSSTSPTGINSLLDSQTKGRLEPSQNPTQRGQMFFPCFAENDCVISKEQMGHIHLHPPSPLKSAA